MRPLILLLVLSAGVLGSCTSAYKTGQTPDDVYFSPQQPQKEYVNVKDRNDDNRYYGDDAYYDDQYLRMKVRNRTMWSDLDDWYYYNSSYSYSYYNSFNWNNPWSPYTYWNYCYNPYASVVIGAYKGNYVYSHPRIFNLNTYNGSQLNNNNYTNPRNGGLLNNNNYYNHGNYNNSPVRINGINRSNSNVNSNTGNFLRNIFNNNSGNNNNSSNSSNSNPSRSSSSSSSSGSSGSSGSSAPVRKF